MEREMERIQSAYFDLGGKTALITGGASGLGRATADRMLRSNANVVIADETLANWEKVNAVDYTGVILANKYAILRFLEQGHGGVICNLASMFGLVAVPSDVAYSAAKGGVVNMTRSAGTAYASQGIRVNCVCPGVINTPLVPKVEKENYRQLHPMHRIGEDFEITSIITFLCCDNARFITGAAIPVDGGYTSI